MTRIAGVALAVVLLGAATSGWGQEGPPGRPPAPPEVGAPGVAPPPPAAPAPRPQPPRPPGPGMHPPALPPHPPGAPADVLLRLIAERRPELAERLEHLRRRSPEHFRRVLVDALTRRLEEALNEAERNVPPGPPERFGPDDPLPPEPPGPRAEHRARLRELEERQARLEGRSHEVAAQLRELREREAPPPEAERVHAELERIVHEQFEVRSELRRMELERLNHELRRLREMVERMERDLAQREVQRGVIVERRLRQLLGEDASGW